MPSLQKTAYPVRNTDIEAANVSVSANFYESVLNGLTALAGGAQATAVLLSALLNRVTVCATAGDSARLPLSELGLTIEVKNAGVNSMNLFPAVGEALNALAVNTAFAVASGKSAWATCHVIGIWDITLSA